MDTKQIKYSIPSDLLCKPVKLSRFKDELIRDLKRRYYGEIDQLLIPLLNEAFGEKWPPLDEIKARGDCFIEYEDGVQTHFIKGAPKLIVYPWKIREQKGFGLNLTLTFEYKIL